MGTSGASDGPNPRTPLVPSWLDDGPGAPAPVPAPAPPAPAPDGQPAPDGNPPPTIPAPPRQPLVALRPLPPPPPDDDRFRSARSNFTSFARSRGSDGRALRRAVRDYVRSGAGTSRNATRRMGASRAAAGNVLGVFRDFQRDGVTATLQGLNLGGLAGRPLADVFLGLTDFICRDGGSIHEGIARDAWLETIAELDALALPDIDALTPDQMQDVFLAFIAHSIEGRLFQDIGAAGFKKADLAAVEAFERQLHDYIRGAVRDSFSGDLADVANLSQQQIDDIVDRTYDDAWELFVTWGDAEG
jgi:hypothetical protein